MGCQNNAYKTWKFVNNQIGETHSKKSCVEILTVDERDITNPKEKAEQYSRYFAEVGKKTVIKTGQ